jgi:biotin carboxylase
MTDQPSAVPESGVLLLLGSGARSYREYLIKSAARRIPLWLFEPDEPTWQRAHVAGYDVVDVFDPAAVVAAAKELAARIPVRGIYCFHEAAIVSAAEVAAALGLHGPAPDAMRACRDKAKTRELLDRAGVEQPRHLRADTVDAARAAATKIGFPLVVKPRGLYSSMGVVKVDGPEALEPALRACLSAAEPGMTSHAEMLLEEFVPGPEISVDSAVFGGISQPFVLAHKETGAPPYFEEVGHSLEADDPLLRDERLLDTLDRMHAALGIHHGITHTELKLGPRGPVIIEVNGRLGGDLIPYLGKIASGIDPADVAVDLALGRWPIIQPTESGGAAIRFFPPSVDCVIRSAAVPFAEPARGVYESEVHVEAGETLRLPPAHYVTRIGYVITVGADRAASLEAMAAASNRVVIEYDELSA